MSEHNSDYQAPPENDPSLEKTKEEKLKNQSVASNPPNRSLPSLEEETLKKAMIDWREKGNERLAQACAEALVGHEKNYEKGIPDDKRTQELKDKINLIEANEEAALSDNTIILDKLDPSSDDNSLLSDESSDLLRKEMTNTFQNTDYSRQPDNAEVENTFLKQFQSFVDTKTILQLIALITLFELARMLYFLFKLF